MPHEPRHIFIMAGEASGDALGAALMEALSRRLHGKVRFSGVGGAAMQAQGMESVFPIQDLSVMGLAEVLPRLPLLLRRKAQILEAIDNDRPDILVTIDSPDFNLRIAKAVHKRIVSGRMRPVPLVHYVAPTVWAWRPGRARKIARFLDGLICLFPFEPPYFVPEGLQAVCAGHPVVAGPFTRGQAARFRREAGIANHQRILGVLPGSRRSEIQRTGPVLAETAQRLQKALPDIVLVVPTLPHLEADIRTLFDGADPSKVLVVSGGFREDAFTACEAALATSGTVGIELAAAGVPHVIAYRMSALSWEIVRRMVRVRHAHLVNILLDETVVPEFLQERCTAEAIFPAIRDLFCDTERASRQRERFTSAMRLLGQGADRSPAEKAADFVCGMLESGPRKALSTA